MTQNPSPAARRNHVQTLLNPQSIAIIGFSQKPRSGGRYCLESIRAAGYSGRVYLVGRQTGEYEGLRIHDDISQLPSGIELAVLLVPASSVKSVVSACIERKMRTGVIFASGFAELGLEARAEQEAISKMAKSNGLALMGPNCMGYTNYLNGLTISFMPPQKSILFNPEVHSGVSILTQSGGLMAHFYQGLSARQIPVAYRISTGNEVSLSLVDFLFYFAKDPKTRVVAAYAEQISDPQAFLEAARQIRQAGKHLVLLHAGKGENAKQATASHTGALATNYQAMSTQVSRAGALLVDSLEEFLDVTELLHRFPKLFTQGVGLMTTSGAICALAYDYFEQLQLSMPALGPDTGSYLKQRLPSFVSARNPLDLTTQVMWDDDLIGDCCRALMADTKVGAVSVVIPGSDLQRGLLWLEGMIKAQQDYDKPLVLSLLGDDMPLANQYLERARSANLVISRSPERSWRALAKLSHYALAYRAFDETASDNTEGFEESAHTQPELARQTSFVEWRSKALIQQAGIQIPPGGLTKSEDDAIAIAQRVGYPVAAKLQASSLTHKTEIGGVILNVLNDEDLREAWNKLMALGRKNINGTNEIDGVLIETMSPKGLEMMIGAKRDPQWGVLLLLGFGGIWVEVLKDVKLLPSTPGPQEVKHALSQLRASALLSGVRGEAARDIDAIVDVVLKVSTLMREHPEIQEIDINPLMVFAEGAGALALDALIAT